MSYVKAEDDVIYYYFVKIGMIKIVKTNNENNFVLKFYISSKKVILGDESSNYSNNIYGKNQDIFRKSVLVCESDVHLNLCCKYYLETVIYISDLTALHRQMNMLPSFRCKQLHL